MARERFTKDAIGLRVWACRDASSQPVAAVILDVNEQGCVCIARLRSDGTMREERIWTGLWWDVWSRP